MKNLHNILKNIRVGVAHWFSKSTLQDISRSAAAKAIGILVNMLKFNLGLKTRLPVCD